MGQFILAYDLGTGGNKAALYDVQGRCLAETFVAYPTFYPRSGWHEQRPADWWSAVVESTNQLLDNSQVDRGEIGCLGISGHSLGVVPVDRGGNLLREYTPIWSDARAVPQSARYFQSIPETEWYLTTGNGFPPPLYSVFKMMWYCDEEPDLFRQIHRVIGTKDYINLLLTGRLVTDHSYASGSGVYDLKAGDYSERLIQASGLTRELWPEIVPATSVIGSLTATAADALGLSPGVQVVAGGVDNSCMSLGAMCYKEGRLYSSMGSSSWIAVSSSQPVLNERSRPYVFAHVVPGQFISSVSLFSAGSSFRWVRDQLCRDLVAEAGEQGREAYDLMTAEASRSRPGSNGLLFNPSLAGGSSVDPGINIRGAFLGLDLGHTRADVIRASMEGVALELRMALDELRQLVPVAREMLCVGGGSRSGLWLQLYADVLNMKMVKTNIDQQAAALGAAVVAGVGAGLWKDFSVVDSIHQSREETTPNAENNAVYEKLMPLFVKASKYLTEIGDDLHTLDL